MCQLILKMFNVTVLDQLRPSKDKSIMQAMMDNTVLATISKTTRCNTTLVRKMILATPSWLVIINNNINSTNNHNKRHVLRGRSSRLLTHMLVHTSHREIR